MTSAGRFARCGWLGKSGGCDDDAGVLRLFFYWHDVRDDCDGSGYVYHVGIMEGQRQSFLKKKRGPMERPA